MIFHPPSYLHQLELAETFNGLLDFGLIRDREVFEIDIQLEGVANLILWNFLVVKLEIDANLAFIHRLRNS